MSGCVELISGEGAYALYNQTRMVHAPIASPAQGGASPGKECTPIAFGAALGLRYAATTDELFRWFKIPATYVVGSNNASFHIHWTKALDADASGTVVRWQLEYIVVNGTSEDVASGTVTKTVDDTYVDASVDGTRIAYRTASVDASAEFQPSYYAGVRVTYVPANTTLSSDPVLFSLDVRHRLYINRPPP